MADALRDTSTGFRPTQTTPALRTPGRGFPGRGFTDLTREVVPHLIGA